MITEDNHVVLFTDGSCLGNPSNGGIGYIITYEKDKEIEGSCGYKLTTNNRMEVLAAIIGLNVILENINNDKIKKPSTILIYTDSKYFSDSINLKWLERWGRNGWKTSEDKPVKNKDLWIKFKNIRDKFKKIEIDIKINHIPGHAGNEYNERCDKLAKTAARGKDLLVDDNYINLNDRK